MGLEIVGLQTAGTSLEMRTDALDTVDQFGEMVIELATAFERDMTLAALGWIHRVTRSQWNTSPLHSRQVTSEDLCVLEGCYVSMGKTIGKKPNITPVRIRISQNVA